MTLTELLQYVRQLFTFELFRLGENPLSVSTILTFVLVLSLFALCSRLLRATILSRALTRLNLDEGTRYNFLRVTHYVILLDKEVNHQEGGVWNDEDEFWFGVGVSTSFAR